MIEKFLKDECRSQESSSVLIDVKALQAGVYMVKVIGNGSSEMLRVVVKWPRFSQNTKWADQFGQPIVFPDFDGFL